MLVTKTDISITCERAKIRPPVTSTETRPSSSGSDAAASEPKTTRRIRSTTGNPADSAFARSSLERSCIAAQSAPWPTKCVATPSWARAATSSSLRRSAATAVASSSETVARSGTTIVSPARAACSARARDAAVSSTSAIGPAASPSRAIAASSCAGVAPSCGIRTAASCAPRAPGKCSSAPSTAADCEPGTPKPPLERSSDWRIENGTAMRTTRAQRARTVRLRRRRSASRRSMADCMWGAPGLLAGWPANHGKREAAVCESVHTAAGWVRTRRWSPSSTAHGPCR